MKKSKEFIKGKKYTGITLISLVITIILLIILAGVAINLSLVENGILNKSLIAKDKTNIKNAEEIIKLAVLENQMAENENGQEGYLENNQLVEKIINQLKSKGYNVEADNDTIKCGKEEIKISDYLEKKDAHKIIINAPKNSIIILSYNEREIAKINVDEETKNVTTNIYREIGDTIIARCKLNDQLIYEKTFQLEENTQINMYPCEENGDGKAIYWYGMEFTNFESGAVGYGSYIFVEGECNKNDNNINLYFNDIYSTAAGVGVYCKVDVTNYNNVEIKVNNVAYTGSSVIMYLVGDVANNYHEDTVKSSYSENPMESENNPIKNIVTKDIQGEKYISIIASNPSGGAEQYGTLSMNIESIVLK